MSIAASFLHNTVYIAGVIAIGYCTFTVSDKISHYSHRMEQKLDHAIVLSQVRVEHEMKSKKPVVKKQTVSENKAKTKKNIKKDQQVKKTYISFNDFVKQHTR